MVRPNPLGQQRQVHKMSRPPSQWEGLDHDQTPEFGSYYFLHPLTRHHTTANMSDMQRPASTSSACVPSVYYQVLLAHLFPAAECVVLPGIGRVLRYANGGHYAFAQHVNISGSHIGEVLNGIRGHTHHWTGEREGPPGFYVRPVTPDAEWEEGYMSLEAANALLTIGSPAHHRFMLLRQTGCSLDNLPVAHAVPVHNPPVVVAHAHATPAPISTSKSVPVQTGKSNGKLKRKRSSGHVKQVQRQESPKDKIKTDDSTVSANNVTQQLLAAFSPIAETNLCKQYCVVGHTPGKPVSVCYLDREMEYQVNLETWKGRLLGEHHSPQDAVDELRQMLTSSPHGVSTATLDALQEFLEDNVGKWRRLPGYEGLILSPGILDSGMDDDFQPTHDMHGDWQQPQNNTLRRERSDHLVDAQVERYRKSYSCEENEVPRMEPQQNVVVVRTRSAEEREEWANKAMR